MSLGLALFILALLLRATTPNRHVRGRLTVSASTFAIFALIASGLAFGRLSEAMRSQLITCLLYTSRCV